MMLGKTFKRDICRPLLVVGNIAHKQTAAMINKVAFKINKSVIKRQSKRKCFLNICIALPGP